MEHIKDILKQWWKAFKKNHIIDENHGWVRSGVPSRQMIRNKDYLEKCGYKYDGKQWIKINDGHFNE